MRSLWLLVLALAPGVAVCTAPAPHDEGTAPPAARRPAEVGEAPVRICTQVGCEDGLAVEVAGTAGETTVRVRAGDGATREGTCAAGAPCQLFFAGFLPARVTVAATAGGTTVERPFTPAWHDVRPNGPDCPPVCRQATVRLDLAPSEAEAPDPAGIRTGA